MTRPTIPAALLWSLACLLPLGALWTRAARSAPEDRASEAPAALGLRVSRDGTLLLRGRPFRGIGVNYFDAFYRTLKDPSDTSYRQGFRELARRGIPFVRFMAGGFWPSEHRLYLTDRDRYFRQMDAVVRAAEEEGIGLIPSLFWNVCTIPDLVGEPVDQWGNPRGKTHEHLRKYVREVVTRYRKSPALWAWEFGNEYGLAADLPNAAEHRPPVVPDLGTPSSRSARDELTRPMIRAAYRAFAQEVRRWDPHRAILNGDAFPRPSAWHQRTELSWKQDTQRQYEQILADDSPDPMNVISVHLYEPEEERFGRKCSAEELLKVTLGVSRRLKKPLFVGEFGASEEKGADEGRQRFERLLKAVIETGVPLAALWVYDFAGQDKTWNVTASNNRAYQLDALEAANREMRSEASRGGAGRAPANAKER